MSAATVQTLPLVSEASTLATVEAGLHVVRITALSQATIAAATAKLAATGDPRYAALISLATQTMQDHIKTSAKVIAAAAGVLPPWG